MSVSEFDCDPAAVAEGETLSREDLICRLKQLAIHYDAEAAHFHADDLLLTYIDDEAISEAFRGVPREYA